VSRGIFLLFMTTGLEGVEGSASRPCRSLLPGKTRYPLYKRLGGPQGRCGQVRKNLAPTGIQSPDHPARKQSLYRLRYPAHIWYTPRDKVNLMLYCNSFLFYCFDQKNLAGGVSGPDEVFRPNLVPYRIDITLILLMWKIG
jgi:hypothetical protein